LGSEAMIEINIDGARFDSVEGFYAELNRHLEPGSSIEAHCLDSLHDVLRDSFGDPTSGYRIRWCNAELSRGRLGYPETSRQLEERLKRCHPDNKPMIRAQLAEARRGRGPTAFDWLVEILREHDHIELELS
jgi:hypothetical protein